MISRTLSKAYVLLVSWRKTSYLIDGGLVLSKLGGNALKLLNEKILQFSDGI